MIGNIMQMSFVWTTRGVFPFATLRWNVTCGF